MTLLDSLRDRVRPDPGSAEAPLDAPTGVDWWAAPVAGALAAAGTWLLLALPALVVWVATAHTTVGWGDALGVASAAWFLGHGAGVTVGDVGLSLAPLGIWLLALLLAVRGARRLLDRTERAAPGTTWPRVLAAPGGSGVRARVCGGRAARVAAGPRRAGPTGRRRPARRGRGARPRAGLGAAASLCRR